MPGARKTAAQKEATAAAATAKRKATLAAKKTAAAAAAAARAGAGANARAVVNAPPPVAAPAVNNAPAAVVAPVAVAAQVHALVAAIEAPAGDAHAADDVPAAAADIAAVGRPGVADAAPGVDDPAPAAEAPAEAIIDPASAADAPALLDDGVAEDVPPADVPPADVPLPAEAPAAADVPAVVLPAPVAEIPPPAARVVVVAPATSAAATRSSSRASAAPVSATTGLATSVLTANAAPAALDTLVSSKISELVAMGVAGHRVHGSEFVIAVAEAAFALWAESLTGNAKYSNWATSKKTTASSQVRAEVAGLMRAASAAAASNASAATTNRAVSQAPGSRGTSFATTVRAVSVEDDVLSGDDDDGDVEPVRTASSSVLPLRRERAPDAGSNAGGGSGYAQTYVKTRVQENAESVHNDGNAVDQVVTAVGEYLETVMVTSLTASCGASSSLTAADMAGAQRGVRLTRRAIIILGVSYRCDNPDKAENLKDLCPDGQGFDRLQTKAFQDEVRRLVGILGPHPTHGALRRSLLVECLDRRSQEQPGFGMLGILKTERMAYDVVRQLAAMAYTVELFHVTRYHAMLPGVLTATEAALESEQVARRARLARGIQIMHPAGSAEKQSGSEALADAAAINAVKVASSASAAPKAASTSAAPKVAAAAVSAENAALRADVHALQASVNKLASATAAAAASKQGGGGGGGHAKAQQQGGNRRGYRGSGHDNRDSRDSRDNRDNRNNRGGGGGGGDGGKR